MGMLSGLGLGQGAVFGALGAAAGAGQAATTIGQFGMQKSMQEQLLTKQNELATAREETIARLRQSGAETLQAKGQEFQKGQLQTEIGARGAAAGAARQFQKEEQTEKLKSEERRTGITASSRVEAARVRADAARDISKGAKPNSPWEFHIVKQGTDPKTQATLPDKSVLLNKQIGYTGVNIGGRYFRTDPQGQPIGYDGKPVDPTGVRRAAASEVQAVSRDPYAVGADGVPLIDKFEKTYGYRPEQWVGAMQSQSQQQQQQQSGQPVRPGQQPKSSLPGPLLRGVGGPNATSQLMGTAGAPNEEGMGAARDLLAENESEAEADARGDQSESSGSESGDGGMGAYEGAAPS